MARSLHRPAEVSASLLVRGSSLRIARIRENLVTICGTDVLSAVRLNDGRVGGWQISQSPSGPMVLGSAGEGVSLHRPGLPMIRSPLLARFDRQRSAPALAPSPRIRFNTARSAASRRSRTRWSMITWNDECSWCLGNSLFYPDYVREAKLPL